MASTSRDCRGARGTGRRLRPDTPARGGDVLHGTYADLLWEPLSPEDTRGLEEFCRRAAQAAGDFRTLVEIVRDGNVLIVFPEGRPSPDGEIGPIKPGIGARRGKPRAIRPLALAYDPSFAGAPASTSPSASLVEPPTEDVEGALPALLRVTMPLTCGQVVAALLQTGADADLHALERDLGDAVAVAREEGRPVEPDLATAAGRRRRLTEALAVAPRRAALPFLAREYASARGFERGVSLIPGRLAPPAEQARERRADQDCAHERNRENGEGVHRQHVRGRLVRVDVDALRGQQRQVVERPDPGRGRRDGQRQVPDALEAGSTHRRAG